MWQTVIDMAVSSVLDILLAIVTAMAGLYIIPAVRNELVPWLKDRHIYNQVKIFVEAAEKLAESGTIEKGDKKAKVTELLKDSGISVDGKVEAFIESAVKQLDLIASSVAEEIKNGD